MSASLDSFGKRSLGLATGLAFGALLQRGRLSRYDVILGQLRLTDGRVVKAMASGVAVGALGLYALERGGMLSKNEVKPMKVGGIVGGALLFGAGLATLGYCPGTTVAAVGEGRRDAMMGVVGMLAGAAAFVALYPKLEALIDAGGDLGKVTLASATKTERLPWAVGVAASTAVGAAALETLPRSAHRKAFVTNRSAASADRTPAKRPVQASADATVASTAARAGQRVPT